MSKVIDLHPKRLTADELLEELKGMYNDIIVIGWTEEDSLAVASSKEMSTEDSYWLLHRVAQVFLNGE